MSGIEMFVEFSRKKPEIPGYRLADAYIKAKAEFEENQAALVKCLRVEKKGDQLIPVFCAEAKTLAGLHWDVEKRLIDIRDDIEAFLKLSGGEPTLSVLADQLVRARRSVSDIDFRYRTELQHAISRGATGLEAESDPEIRALHDRRDAVQAEMRPVIEDLVKRLADAKRILEKYNTHA